MKRKLQFSTRRFAVTLVSAFILTSSTLFAQVKIGANSTTIGTNSNLEVESTSGGKVIVNKTSGQLTIKDGTEGAGKVLTSDANGAANWQPSGSTIIKGTIGSFPNLTNGDGFVYSNSSITIPAGKWLLFFNATYRNDASAGANIFWDLSTSNTSNTITARVLSTAAPTGTFMPVSAIFEVSPSTSSTYYFWSRLSTIGTGTIPYTGEGRIFAMSVQ